MEDFIQMIFLFPSIPIASSKKNNTKNKMLLISV